MAFVRYPVEYFATLEINRATFEYDGNIISQTPMSEEFTRENPLENGMVLGANAAHEYLKPIENVNDAIGIVYTSEQDYESARLALGRMAQWYSEDGLHPNDVYPRLGVLVPADVMTTNCFGYETDDFADVMAVNEALAAIKTTPLYVVPVVGNPVLKLTATKPATGHYGQVSKFYTVPNGEKGIKYAWIQ